MRGSANWLSSDRGRLSPGVLLPPVLLLVATGVAVVFLTGGSGRDITRDADLCPVQEDRIRGSSVFLVDLRKPVAADGAGPGDLLRRITLWMGADEELRVVLLMGSSASPRGPLSRLCKPYANADLQIDTAKDGNGSGPRDCGDLPAQIPPDLRESATRFCALRTALGNRLNELAAEATRDQTEPQNAYLVEAIEDIKLDLQQRPAPHVLYLFSDLMQHAGWYSHLEVDWEDWDHTSFSELLTAQPWYFGSSANTGLRAEVFYLPRAGLTDQPRASRLHQEFWRDYLGKSDVRFHVQPVSPGYAARPLMNRPDEARLAAEERAAAEELLAQIERERESLRRQQEELARQAARTADERRRAETQRAVGGEQPVIRPPAQVRTSSYARGSVSPREPEAEEAKQAAPRLAVEEGQNGQEPVDIESQDGDAAFQGEPDQPGMPAVCELALAPANEESSPLYPRGGRMDFGEAVVAVRYVVDDLGETVDSEIEVVSELSQVDRERYFELFAESALETVRRWRFVFVDPESWSCTRRQSRTTSFHFTYR